MLDFQQKRKVRGVLYNRITLYALGALVLLVLHSTWSVYNKRQESEEMKNITLQRTEELRSRDAELRAKIERLDTASGIEEEIRSKFSVAKENEAIVVVVADTETSSTTVQGQKRGFWSRVAEWFGM